MKTLSLAKTTMPPAFAKLRQAGTHYAAKEQGDKPEALKGQS